MSKIKPTILISVVPLLLFFSVGAFIYTGTPSFCQSCHEMSSLHTTWQHSSHARLNCLSCHSEPGTIGEIKTHLAGLEQVYKHFTNLYIKPIKAEVTNDVCLDCHKGIENKNTVGDIVMVHGRHLRKEVKCTGCHALVVHKDTKLLVKSPSEVDCIQCHSQKDVSIECITCHKKAPVLGRTRG
ncbi:MAG: NapC/NirT family cytochrome c [Chloroflexi bacterium]|nr:NapC/NirT family cytochrome c [Chloroflexota bacterium]MCL5075466.1 NapC/NirT family cytochrome c [Chloroflexota bacterium]